MILKCHLGDVRKNLNDEYKLRIILGLINKIFIDQLNFLFDFQKTPHNHNFLINYFQGSETAEPQPNPIKIQITSINYHVFLHQTESKLCEINFNQ